MTDQPVLEPAPTVPDPAAADAGTLAALGAGEPVGGGEPDPPPPPWQADP